MKPLILGEAFSRQGDLVNAFTGPSGDRLQALCGAQSYLELQCYFTLKNLCKGITWDVREARRTAATLKLPELVILAGRKVAGVYGYGNDTPWYHPQEARFQKYADTTFYVMPHPSGLSRYWNDPENVHAARLFLSMMSMVHTKGME